MVAASTLATDIITTGNEETINPGRKGSIVSFDATQLGKPAFASSVDSIHGYDEGALGPSPTEEDLATLRKVPGKMPTVAYTLCAVEFAERASYYGVFQIFNNFVQFPLPKGGNGAGATPVGTQETPGALGMGLQAASGFSLTFKFLSYTLPILGAWIADVKWGRYKTVCLGVALCGVAHIIMTAGAAPSVLQSGHGLPPFLISMIMLSVGAGLFKSNISPMLIDQNPHKRPYVKTLDSGERVIVDPETTISRILLWFYMMVNVGAFFALATTYSEKRVGWWLAFLLPAVIYFLLPILLAVMYKRTIKVKPTGNDLGRFLKVIGTSFKVNGLFGAFKKNALDAVKPSHLATTGSGLEVNWDDKFVNDVKRTLVACQVFIFFPVFYMNDNGIGAIQSSQGATMVTNGAPNDLLNNFNPLTIIVVIPLLNYGFYPFLRKHKIEFGRIKRITLGFFLVAINGLVGTILQWKVYTTSPCGYRATECAESDGTVAPITIWTQIPIYVLGAVAECFAVVTAYDVAYSRAAGNMKSIVTSLFLFMNALSAAIGAAVTPATRDPYLIWIFAGPTIGGFILTPLFYWLFRHLDKEDESKMNLYDLPDESRTESIESDDGKPDGERFADEKVDRTDKAAEAGKAT